MMQHPQQQHGPVLAFPVVLRVLWPRLGPDGICALRSCCTPLRDASAAWRSPKTATTRTCCRRRMREAVRRFEHDSALSVVPSRHAGRAAPAAPLHTAEIAARASRGAGGGMRDRHAVPCKCAWRILCCSPSRPSPHPLGGHMHGCHAHAWMPLGCRCAVRSWGGTRLA
jgi:hypothetical protein